jgi:hypothetical protein
MTTSHLLRRAHLYLGLALLPWLFMYGISSIPFTHSQYFQERDAAKKIPLWTARFERSFDQPVPADPVQRREFGRALLEQVGLGGRNLGVYSPNPNTLFVDSYAFLRTSRVVYAIPQKKITVEDRRFRFDQFLTGMHARGGFEQEGFLADSWGVVVDIVCVAMILWIVTGYYMWWGVSGHRLWGWVAILAGLGSFVVFTVKL